MKEVIFACMVSSFMLICSCVNKSSKNEGANIVSLDGQIPVEPDGIIELDLFSQTNNYDNNLSRVASHIEFIHLDTEPVINDFRIADIAISDEFLFLADIYQIFQYDQQGNFIRYISRQGGGPGEYYQLTLPLQLDNKQELIYASDGTLKKIFVYKFDGTFQKAITIDPNSISRTITVIDTATIALRQTIEQMCNPNAPKINFIDQNGKITKSYPSYTYPFPREKMKTGVKGSFIWEGKGKSYMLEYGTDTIFRIQGDSLIPARKLTGELKINNIDDYFDTQNIGRKLTVISSAILLNAGVFESDYYIIFKLLSSYETFYKIYEKTTGQFFQTFYGKSPVESPTLKRMDFFIDDLVSGLHINFKYQSGGKAITTISAEEIVEKREAILEYISKNPSEEGEKLKAIVGNIDEMDNSVVMIVTFK